MNRFVTAISTLLIFTSCHKQLVVSDVDTSHSQVDSTVSVSDETADFISPYKARLDSTMNAVLCRSAQELPKSRTAMESALGNFMADLSYEWVVKETPDSLPKPDFAVLNKGGIRSSLPEGDVTTGHIYELMPFDNYLVTVELSGEETMMLFRYLARVGGQPIANATVGIRNKKPVDITIDGQPLDLRKKYFVVTSNYLAGGGDNMTFFVGQPKYTYGLLRDYIIKECKALKASNKQLEAKIDGRVWGDK